MMAETVVYSREVSLHPGACTRRANWAKSRLHGRLSLAPGHGRLARILAIAHDPHATPRRLAGAGAGRRRAEYVSCFGSGTINERLAQKSGNPFAVESCHIKIKDSDVAAHIWRFLFDTARQYRESFDVYGTKKSFEWALIEGEEHIIHTAKKPEPEIAERASVPDYAHRLPEAIRRFTTTIQDAGHLSFIQGGGHGGSAHLVHAFVSALVERTRRLGQTPPPAPTGPASASAPHQSAQRRRHRTPARLHPGRIGPGAPTGALMTDASNALLQQAMTVKPVSAARTGL